MIQKMKILNALQIRMKNQKIFQMIMFNQVNMNQLIFKLIKILQLITQILEIKLKTRILKRKNHLNKIPKKYQKVKNKKMENIMMMKMKKNKKK